MDSMAKAAFIMSRVGCMQARLAEMEQQNIEDRLVDRHTTYSPADFGNVADEFGLGHNDVIIYLQQGY